MGVESYLHRYAKIVVASWLRKKIRIGPKFKGLNNIVLDLELPKEKPMFDVYTEFPVCKDKNGTLIGLDSSWKKWLSDNDRMKDVRSKSFIPTEYELKDNFDDLKVLAVFDVAIIDKDRLKYAFEIMHTHACTNKKIKFVKDNDIIGYEISAQKIMEQVKLPYSIDILSKWNVD